MAFNPNNPTHNDDPDLTLYARPTSSTAVAWDGDAVDGEEATFGGSGIGSYSFAVALNRNWVIYEQLGASPAATDTPIATIEADPRRSDRLTLMAAGGTLTDVEWTYDTEQTNPELKVYRGASLESSPAATGTGKTFYFDVSIPSGAAIGEVIRVLTDEDPAREVLIGQVVTTTPSTTLVQDLKDAFSGQTTFTEPTIDSGQITSDIVIGDDYLAAKGARAFTWNIPSVSGVTIGTATCFFGANGGKKGSFLVEGSLSDVGDGTWNLTFDVARSVTASLEPGEYKWSVAVHDEDGTEITRVRNSAECYRVTLVEKQT